MHVTNPTWLCKKVMAGRVWQHHVERVTNDMSGTLERILCSATVTEACNDRQHDTWASHCWTLCVSECVCQCVVWKVWECEKGWDSTEASSPSESHRQSKYIILHVVMWTIKKITCHFRHQPACLYLSLFLFVFIALINVMFLVLLISPRGRCKKNNFRFCYPRQWITTTVPVLSFVSLLPLSVSTYSHVLTNLPSPLLHIVYCHIVYFCCRINTQGKHFAICANLYVNYFLLKNSK